MGPCLIKQDAADSKSNVKRRVEYLQGQLKDYEKKDAEYAAKLKKGKEEILLMQNMLIAEQQAAVAAATKGKPESK
jgi:chaperonin cofactor prefoldin